MNRLRKDKLLGLINLEIGKVSLSVTKTSEDKKIRRSRSQAGDRYHAESAALITQKYLSALKSLRKEIISCSDGPSSSAKPVSYVVLEYDNGERVEFYFVKNRALVTGVLLITQDSPIGKAILNKKEGGAFSYNIKKGEETITYSGKVKQVE